MTAETQGLLTKEQAAKLLDGSEYGEEGSRDLWKRMKEAGLVAVFGASDDLMEFRGAIDDEIGCYGGGRALVDSTGLLPHRSDISGDDELECFFARKKIARVITAHWDKDGYSWIYSTAIPHVTFNVAEDGEMYCCGVVFALCDVAPTALAKAETGA